MTVPISKLVFTKEVIERPESNKVEGCECQCQQRPCNNITRKGKCGTTWFRPPWKMLSPFMSVGILNDAPVFEDDLSIFFQRQDGVLVAPTSCAACVTEPDDLLPAAADNDL